MLEEETIGEQPTKIWFKEVIYVLYSRGAEGLDKNKETVLLLSAHTSRFRSGGIKTGRGHSLRDANGGGDVGYVFCIGFA